MAMTDATLTTIALGLPALEGFTISHCERITSKCVQRIAPLGWSKLKTLGLVKCTGVSDMALAAVARNRVRGHPHARERAVGCVCVSHVRLVRLVYPSCLVFPVQSAGAHRC